MSLVQAGQRTDLCAGKNCNPKVLRMKVTALLPAGCGLVSAVVLVCALCVRAGSIDNRDVRLTATTNIVDDTTRLIWRNGSGEGQKWSGQEVHDVADGQVFSGGPTIYTEAIGGGEKYDLRYVAGKWFGYSPNWDIYLPGLTSVSPVGTYSAVDMFGNNMQGTFEYAKITNVVWR